MKTLGFAAAALMFAASPLMAATVAVTSYDMPNGDSGTYHYWDLNYTGTGSTTTDGAALSGGVGDLTDGVIASDFWYNVENSAGSGPYVGWVHSVTPNPLITFNFAGNNVINSIAIHIDNSFVGGVSAPAKILVDGIDTAFTAPAAGTIGMINITGLNLTGNSHTIQFEQAQSGWTFVSEVTFGAVPEPASWAMMITGFGLVGATMRRRRAVIA